jgi:hypothetical protein
MAQAQLVATILVRGLELYALAGIVTALAFLSFGMAHVLPSRPQVTLGARLLLFPGAVGLWPVIVGRWVKARGER